LGLNVLCVASGAGFNSLGSRRLNDWHWSSRLFATATYAQLSEETLHIGVESTVLDKLGVSTQKPPDVVR
jgi:hypothetical protein